MPGMKTGAALGALVPGFGETGISEAVGGFLGGMVSSGIAAAGAAWAQHKAAQMIAPEKTEAFNKELEAGEKQHPVAGTVGRIAAALPMFELSPFESVQGVSAIYKAAKGEVLTEIEKKAARATAAQVGLGTGQAVVQPLLFGDSPTKQGIAEAFVQSLLLGHPRYEIFGAHAEKALVNEEAGKDAQQAEQQSNANPVENPASTYATPPAPPVLTPAERGKLSMLAGKAVSGSPMGGEDAVTHRLMADNEEARTYFEQEKQKWANEKTRLLAVAAMERSDFGDVKNGQSDYAGGEMPKQGGAELAGQPVETTAPTPSESQPAEKPAEKPAPIPQPVAETPPTPAAPVASTSQAPTAPAFTMPHLETKEQIVKRYPMVSPELVLENHKGWIKKALAEGKQVPKEVLAQYPGIEDEVQREKAAAAAKVEPLRPTPAPLAEPTPKPEASIQQAVTPRRGDRAC